MMILQRCVSCGKVLFEIDLKEGTIKKLCKCGTMNIITTEKAAQSFQEKLTLVKK